jgi:asparagine synthase (glutamine-hydrolysing)
MCGIAGGIHTQLSRKQIDKALLAMRHRGPDDSGIWMNEEVWLGNTRLAIQDLSVRGHQPMSTPDGRYTLVYNGEIYNHGSIRKQLEASGVVFQSTCDTETLLQAYAIWGSECLAQLEGDFAFAIYDVDKREVFIARDPLGVKPLYYYNDGKQVLFASELKALLNLPGVNYSLAPEVFYQYLLFLYSPSEETPFRHFRKLLPGHFLRLQLDAIEEAKPKQYYTLPFTGKHTTTSESELVNELDTLLYDVIKQEMHSDAPIGFFLSGGLDSSLITALAGKAAPHTRINAFTIDTGGAMRNEGFGDDLPFAQSMAQRLNADLHIARGNIDLGKELDRTIWQLDEPQADPAAMHVAHISKVAHNMGIKVLLSGTGGDDVFSGYRRHIATQYFPMMERVPRAASGLATMLAGTFPKSVTLRRAEKLVRTAGWKEADAVVAAHLWAKPESIEGLFTKELRATISAATPFSIFHDLLKEIPGENILLNTALFWELKTFLPHHNLAYTDKMAMSESIEVRVPYVDKRIVAFAAALPPELKLKGNTTKYILRQVAKRYLPEAIINRKKTGFGAPVRQWAAGPGHEYIRARLLDKTFLDRGIFDSHAIENLISDNEQGRIDGAYTLFSLLAIESWLRQFAPQPAIAS